jgi:hypothetical protein
MRIGGKLYEEDLVLYPDGKIETDWYRKEEERVSPVDIRSVLDYQPELVIVGQGDRGSMVVTPDSRDALSLLGIGLIEKPTGDAVLLFNEYQQEGRKTVGLFHLGP